MSDEMRDEQLLAQLAAVLETVDPVPVSVLEAAKAVFTWRTIDAELASLAFDSATDELAGVRSADTARQLTFRTDTVEIELVVVSGRLVGQLVPPQQAAIVLHHGGEERTLSTDDLGRFAFDDVAGGPIRLTCTLADGVVQTEWTIV